ncbi:Cna B-type domain-containing protein [Lapidilactobacillus luobeiensis]|uniref:Cna B-type domain-containing protein n=1 Tax=Lapidilactobacillus luobeiensis TaxID=2950371 RepID=UPI0021C4395C|nr:Cna B-type domain-containing protein [Lapidilactobacillus luobeiensis]
MLKKILQRAGRVIAITFLATTTLLGSGSGLVHAADNPDVPNGGDFYNDVPEAESAPLHAAQFFHIFSQEAHTNAHTNGNIATDDLYSNTNFGTNIVEGSLEKDIYYFQDVKTISPSAFVSSLMDRNKAVFGAETNIGLLDQNNQSAISVNTNPLDHLQESEVFQDKGANQYINITTVLGQALDRSNEWAQEPDSPSISADFSDQNNQTISVDPSQTGAQIVLTKQDTEGQLLPDAIFNLYRGSDDSLIAQNLRTNSQGQLRVTVAGAGLYYFVEQKAPNGYQLDTSRHYVTVTDENIAATNGQAFQYYKLDAKALANDRPIKITGLSRDGAPLIINVDLDNVREFAIKAQIKLVIDGSDRQNHETEDFDDAKILWNFTNSNKTVINVNAPFQGTMLAPQAEIIAHQNIDGSLIANKVNIEGGETHRWDFQDQNSGEPAQITVINTKKNLEVSKTTFSGQKFWDDGNDQDGLRPVYVTVKLWRQVNGGAKTYVAKRIVTASSDWRYQFKDLPTHDTNGNKITYSVTEKKVAGYTTTSSGPDLINRHTPALTQIQIKKNWVDENDQAGKRPDSVSAHLWRHDTDGIEKVTDFTLSAANNWQAQFKDLPKYDQGTEIHYFITEDDIPDYSSTINGFDLTNRLDLQAPVTTTIFGSKVWHDDDNIYNNRPDKVTVILKKASTTAPDGWIEVARQEVSAKTNWEYFFTDLPKNDEQGKPIVYRVFEFEDPKSPSGYTVTQDGHDLINTADPDLPTNVTTSFINIRVHKYWNDQDNSAQQRPQSIKVQLYANDMPKYEAKTLSAAQGWVALWLALPKYDESGKLIKYTVKEETPAGYQLTCDKLPLLNDDDTQEINLINTPKDPDDNDGEDPDQGGEQNEKPDGDGQIPDEDQNETDPKEKPTAPKSNEQKKLPQSNEVDANDLTLIGISLLLSVGLLTLLIRQLPKHEQF